MSKDSGLEANKEISLARKSDVALGVKSALQCDGKWWKGFRHVASKMKVDETSLKVLEDIGDKLLEGPLFFKGPSEEDKDAVKNRRPLVFLGGERTLDPSFANTTMRISSELGLNEVQSYCLLKQYKKQAQVETKELLNVTDNQLEEINDLYKKERQSLLSCLIGAVKLRHRCQDKGDDIAMRIEEKWDGLYKKNWAKNILGGFKYIVSSSRELKENMPANLGIEELNLLLEFLALYYRASPPSQDGVIDLLQTVKVLVSSTFLAEMPWELTIKIWRIFMIAIDFPAMLCRIGAPSVTPHRLAGSLKKIDAEIQELAKCENNSVGVIIVAWALFLGLDQRAQKCEGEEEISGVDPRPYFSMVNQEYIFAVLDTMSTTAHELHEEADVESLILMAISAIIVVAQNLMSSHQALNAMMDIMLPILEGNPNLAQDVWTFQEYTGLRDLLFNFKDWFPALSLPCLKLLGALCNERLTSEQAGVFELSHVTMEHDTSDERIKCVSEDVVEALANIDGGPNMHVKEGSQGNMIPCPFPDKVFIKWECCSNVFHIMETKLNRIFKGGMRGSIPLEDKLEVMAMLALFKRFLASPRWFNILEASRQPSYGKRVVQNGYWMRFAHCGLVWFTSIQEYDAVADCLAILGKHACFDSTYVATVASQCSFLNPKSERESDHHIYKQLAAVGSKSANPNVVSNFVTLISDMVKEGMVGEEIKIHIEMIFRMLPVKLKCWNRNLSVYEELTTSLLLFFSTILSASWCRHNGCATRALSIIVHSPGMLQIILESAPVQDLDSPMRGQFSWKYCRVANAQLNLMNLLLNLDESTKKTVAEALIEVPRGSTVSRCVALILSVLPTDELVVPGNVEARLLVTLKALILEFLSNLLEVLPLLGRSIGMEFLVPCNPGGQGSSFALEAIKEGMCKAFQLENAKQNPWELKICVNLLAQAAQNHLQLLDILLSGQEPVSEAEGSILGGLIKAVSQSRVLSRSNPDVCFHFIRCVHLLWLQRKARPSMITTLTVKEDFWSSLMDILQNTKSKGCSYHFATRLHILQILVMESVDGWSGHSGTAVKKLWIESDTGDLWSKLMEVFSQVDNASSINPFLLCQAQKVALELLIAVECQPFKVDIQLLEMMKKVNDEACAHESQPLLRALLRSQFEESAFISCSPSVAVVYTVLPASYLLLQIGHNEVLNWFGTMLWCKARGHQMSVGTPKERARKLQRLLRTVQNDNYMEAGQVFLSGLDKELNIWSSQSTYWAADDFINESVTTVIPPTFLQGSQAMPKFLRSLNESRRGAFKMRSSIAALKALLQLAVRHWSREGTNSSAESQATAAESLTKMISNWVGVARSPPVPSCLADSSPLIQAWVEGCHLSALKVCHTLVLGLQFFIGEVCSSVCHERSKMLRRLRSPTRSPTVALSSPGDNIEDELPFSKLLIRVFKLIDEVLAALDKENSDSWMEPPHNLTGVALSMLVTVLFEYPFPSTNGSAKTVPMEIQDILTSRIVESLCWLVNEEDIPEVCLTESLVGLGALQEFDIWHDENILFLSEKLNLPDLIAKAARAIPSFAQMTGKGTPRAHWSSAVLGLLHFVAKSHSASTFLLSSDALMALFKYGKCLLNPEIGGLGTPMAHPKNYITGADAQRLGGDVKVNFRGAYDPECYFWRVEHEQWLLFIRIMESIVLNPRAVQNAPLNFQEQLASQFQPAIVKALEFPIGSHKEPLTQAQLLETIAMLRFAAACMKSSCPMALMTLRKAVARFVDLCAHMGESSSIMYCQPVSDLELANANENSAIAGLYGWFKKFAEGSRANGGDQLHQKKRRTKSGNRESHRVRFQTSDSSGPLTTSSALDVPETPQHLVVRCGDASLGYGDIDAGFQQDQDKGSKYSFLLGESMYTCIYHCLQFLLSAAPVVTSKEADDLGPCWPSKTALVCIRQDCLNLAANISRWEMEDFQVQGVLNSLRCIIRMSTELLGILGSVPQGNEMEVIESRLQEIDRYLDD